MRSWAETGARLECGGQGVGVGRGRCSGEGQAAQLLETAGVFFLEGTATLEETGKILCWPCQRRTTRHEGGAPTCALAIGTHPLSRSVFKDLCQGRSIERLLPERGQASCR